MFSLKNGGYIYVSLSPSIHSIKIGSAHFLLNWTLSDVEATIDLEKGKRYFLKFQIESDSIVPNGRMITFLGNAALVSVDEKSALSEMSGLNSSV